MHRFRRAAALAALPLLAASAVAAQAPFEGIVVMKTTMEGKTFETTQYVKGNKTRQDIAMQGHSSIQINDMDAQKGYILMPEQKKYMVTDYNELRQTAKDLTEATKGVVKKDDHAMPKLTNTGKTETVAGHQCAHYTMSADASTTFDFCVVRGMGMWQLGAGGTGGAGRGGATGDFLAQHPEIRDYLKEFKDGFLPIKTTVTKNGKVQMVSEATSIERKSLGHDVFEVPAGYSEIKIPKIPGLTGRRP
jgi:uncharacterized protein DUF4412